MNKKTFAAALLLSALPVLALAGPVAFEKGDFRSAEKITRNGQTLVRVKLSKSGKAKVRRLNKESVGESVHAEVGGVGSDFRLREPIRGDGLEMGPYEPESAGRVVQAINGK